MKQFEIVRDRAVIEGLIPVLKRPAELPFVSSFKIASYNVHNLFGEDSEKPTPVEQLKALGEMIRTIGPDAIAFQEVQNEQVLRLLFRKYVNPRLGDDEKYDAFVHIEGNDPRDIDVALVTRLSVRGTLSFHDREFGPAEEGPVRFSRDLLGVELNATPDYRFLFFVSHLKSKIGGAEAEQKRNLEAAEIRSILGGSAFGGAPFINQDLILAGDMNDDPDSRTIHTLAGDGSLQDVLAPLGESSYPTHRRYRPTRFDYILASAPMARRVADPEIHKDEAAVTASDHYPVSATIRVALDPA